ncbi:hypothetical protein BD779DRAFT_1493342 [Infundibulicybe gibba]|nr:hypothetical protein BD779DRAFT_1493342 [Infundibulicybe gibba]
MAQQNALLITSREAEPTVGVRAAAALNPLDWKIKAYDLIVGHDGAGDVEEVGEGVVNVSRGDRVFYQGTYPGDRATFQQFGLALAPIAFKIPAHMSYEEAATIPSTLSTASSGLYKEKPNGFALELGAGNKVEKPMVIIGGSTSVGQFVIQLARLSGFSHIITTSSLRHTEYLKSLGATYVIDRNALDAAEISKLTNAPIEYIYDAVSSQETQQTAYDLLAPGGQLAVVLPSLEPIKGFDSQKSIFVVAGGLNLANYRESFDKFYRHLPELLNSGEIKPNRVEVLPGGLQGIISGLDRLQKEQVSGVKLVARPQE